MKKKERSMFNGLVPLVKLKLSFATLILTLFCSSNLMQAQVRTEVNQLDVALGGDLAALQAELAGLMQTYITADVITEHCNTITLHNDFNFLDFHRVYIQKMEDWLRQQNLGPVDPITGTGGFGSKYVPLPSWDQTYSLPVPLRVIDADCPPASSCTVNPGSGCGTPNWSPTNPLPDYLTFVSGGVPHVTGQFNDLCDWTTLVGSMGFSRMLEGGGGSTASGDPDGNSAFDPDPTTTGNQNVSYHNRGHFSMGGIMNSFRAPSALSFWFWHAYVDDIWKQWECSCTHAFSAPAVDLYSKDNDIQAGENRDDGTEPSTHSVMWQSPDIWVRNQQDGFSTDVSENANYDPVNKPYVYVRVRNRGCSTSSGTDEVKLYWGKSNANFPFPSYWDGSTTIPNNVPVQVLSGNMIGTQTIPALGPGESITIRMEWTNLPDPDDYVGAGINGDNHFCLLSRIESTVDPVPATGPQIGAYVVNNNNVAWKNIGFYNDNISNPISAVDDTYDLDGNGIFRLTICDVVNAALHGMHSSVTVGNGSERRTITTDIRLEVESTTGRTLTDEATLYICVTNGFYEAWTNSGGKSEGMRELGEWPLRQTTDVRSDKRWFEMQSEKASFNGVEMSPEQMERVAIVGVYAPEMKAFDSEEFAVGVVQYEDNKALGGYTFLVADPECGENPALNDVTIRAGQRITLRPTHFSKSTLYIWSEAGDCDENVLSLDAEFEVAPRRTTTYLLTTVSPTGCITEDPVTVSVRGGDGDGNIAIGNIAVYPNPAVESVTVKFDIEKANFAYLEIVKADEGYRQQVEVSDRSSEVVVNLAKYPSGVYNIRLIVDGQQASDTNFVKL